MNKQLKTLSLLLLTLAVLLACSASSQAAAEQEKVVFKETTDAKGKAVKLQMHVYKPEGWSADDNRPAIVFFFGGGWSSGTPAQFFPHCRDLSERGFVAISAEYRVSSKHKTKPQACVEDGKSAVRYLRANAATLGIDPDRIVAAGGSAGGHVAATTGILTGYEAKGEDHTISSVPNLMILFNPVIDTSTETGYGSKKVGKNPESLSPLHQLHKDQPPSMIVHGDADTTVSIKSVRRFTEQSNAIGTQSILHEYEGAAHGFFNHREFRKPKAGTPDYYAQTMQQVYGFLERNGYLQAKD